MESQSPSAAFPFQAILPESGETPPLVHSFPWSNQLGSNTKFGATTQLGTNYFGDTILGYILSRQGDNKLRFDSAEYKRLFHRLAKKQPLRLFLRGFLQRFPFDASGLGWGWEEEELAGLILSRLGASFRQFPSPYPLFTPSFNPINIGPLHMSSKYWVENTIW